jgi:carotenoid cleavage dioxygenase
LDVATRNVDCQTLDATPQRFGRINPRLAVSHHRFVYTVGTANDLSFDGTSVHKHDLTGAGRESHDFGAGRCPGEFLFVEDPERTTTEDGGWLLGLVHDVGEHTSLVVLDAADVTAPPVATVTIPRRVPFGLHGLWIATVR